MLLLKMCKIKLVYLVTAILVTCHERLFTVAGPITFKNGGYEGVVVSIADEIPAAECRNILNSLETTMSGASQFLSLALDGRAFFSSVTILLPDSWPDSCAPSYVRRSDGETPDIKVGFPHPMFRNSSWTQQSQGCGQPGDFIYVSYKKLQESKSLSRSLVQQWAKYRYGVFDETGYNGDPIYPMCYIGDQNRSQVTGCSNLPLEDIGMCDSPSALQNLSSLLHPDARASIMFASQAPHVTRFCDTGTHNRYAPTKHNLVCERKSVMEVILQHPDFAKSISDAFMFGNTTPLFHYKRHSLTRYALVIENTRAMDVRQSWNFLRNAIRKWAVLDLAANSEVAIISANETAAARLHHFSSLSTFDARTTIASDIPYNSGDSHAAGCLHCGIREAVLMHRDRIRTHGPASSVIVIIAPGMDHSLDVNSATAEALDLFIRIATVNYPGIMRARPLDALAYATGGPAYTVQETRYNLVNSYLSTYFKLVSVMFDIATHFYQGSPSGMPIEIHRRELTDDGRSSVTGSFVLDDALGRPASFVVYTHDVENPLIQSITLISPSQVIYDKPDENILFLKLITMRANFNESGTWTYTIQRYPGNPQPHYVQVVATPRTPTSPVVRVRAWTSQSVTPLIIYAEVKQADFPVMGARVEVTAIRLASNGTEQHKEKFELLDTGSGDPDITKGDGVYCRYFSPIYGGHGLYTFQVTVTDNGNTAYTWQSFMPRQYSNSGSECCGSVVPTPAVQALSPFQRVLPALPVTFTSDDVAAQTFVGRIGDLRCEILASDLKARLSWTAPDMGGTTVARYELRYAHSVADIVDRFDTAANIWEYGTPFPLAPGSETTFTMDFTRNPSLLDSPLFVSVRGFPDTVSSSSGGPVSNWVRVLVPSPPPPPPPPSTVATSTYDLSSWPYESGVEDDAVIPRIAQGMDFGLELILPIVGGVALLTVCLAVYCVLRRRQNNPDKKSNGKEKHTSNGKQQVTSSNTAITIVPSSPTQINNGNNNVALSPQHNRNNHGLPSQFQPCLTDEKKRFSVAPSQSEDQLAQQHDQMVQHHSQQPQQQQQIREMSPHIVPHHNGSTVSGISTISTGVTRARTLSPYQSWTASQLLHEHERRHSPYGAVGEELGSPANHGPLPPPVPPLPAFNPTHKGVYSSGPLYGVHPGTFASGTYPRNGSLVPFNPSLQGSLSSVSSGDRKKRNVTMV